MVRRDWLPSNWLSLVLVPSQTMRRLFSGKNLKSYVFAAAFTPAGWAVLSARKRKRMRKKAVKELGIEAEVVHIYNQAQMLARDITSSPVLAIDGELKIADRVPEVEKITKLLSRYR